jgi:hypothetical protein
MVMKAEVGVCFKCKTGSGNRKSRSKERIERETRRIEIEEQKTMDSSKLIQLTSKRR